MNLKKIIPAVLRRVPPKQRQRLKSLYERLPGFGRNVFFSHYGEDAFLQAYFRQKYNLSHTEEMMLPAYLQTAVGPGYYVDVGASAPVRHSNTYWFYQRGWRGINIDAAPGTKQLFERVRPHDVNVEALVSDEETELAFYHFDTPFGVNTLSEERALYGQCVGTGTVDDHPAVAQAG